MIRRVGPVLAGAVLFAAMNAAWAQDSGLRTVHVFVALADNEHQGIIPVPAKLGNGEDAERNLYWGSAYGVKTFFGRSADWARISCGGKPKAEVLERCVFKHRAANVYLVADAYRGIEIRQAILDFLDSAAGDGADAITLPETSGSVKLPIRGGANLVAYIGHDGLMDFQLPRFPHKKNEVHRDAVVLACASKQFFAEPVRASGAYPLVWTTGLMAPEAYTLKSALDGWIAGESSEQIRDRAAGAYDRYQKCGVRAARRLLVSGW
ncbi:MAG TPA: hypothetical protein VFE61_18455 [Candidatus Sulfotelmatobacter sp.]|nr:hypothetical protein [Candidatus Sulfotelmatobacter sp.]